MSFLMCYRKKYTLAALLLVLHLFIRGAAYFDRSKEALYTFEDYKRDHGRKYADSAEHDAREALFQRRQAQILAHNRDKSSTYKLGFNHMSDRTEVELKKLRGYRRQPPKQKPAPAGATPGSSLLQFEEVENITENSCVESDSSCLGDGTLSCCSGSICGSSGTCAKMTDLPEEKNYAQFDTVEPIEQGECGSCWAVTATAAVQMHAAILAGFKGALSPQAVLGCTPNLKSCGGDGGCQGATPELAFDWVKSQGDFGAIRTLQDEAYTAYDKGFPCPSSEKGSSFLDTRKRVSGVGIKGWVKLQDNSGQAMLEALAFVGPVAASIVGGDLHLYASGVFNGCTTYEVDHAILMMGYGHESGVPYWNIRNSWGSGWGEKGYFRLMRAGKPQEEPCGWDLDPAKGVACKENGKYPEKQWVCGYCAILTDSSYPTGTFVPKQML